MTRRAESTCMTGFPPAGDDLITSYSVMGTRENVRWTLHHARELLPTVNVRAADSESVCELTRSNSPALSEVLVPVPSNGAYTVLNWLVDTNTDGFIVLHHGAIAYEYYAGDMQPHEPHSVMSDTKSIVGTLAAELLARRVIHPGDPVVRYVPELRNSGWRTMTLQRTLDMTTHVKYVEDYDDPAADVYRYSHALGWDLESTSGDGPRSVLSYLQTVGEGDPSDESFEYQTVNTEVMAWVLQRATQAKLAHLVSDMIWKPIGAAFDAYFTVDAEGTAAAGGGFNATLRDLARFAQMICNRGTYNGKQVLSAAAFRNIFVEDYPVRLNGVFPGTEDATYHNYWYLHYDPSVLIANGIHGQFIYINMSRDVVIVKLSSAPEAMPKMDLTYTPPLRDRGFSAIVEALTGS